MYVEPDTVWGRTVAGDQAVATPDARLSPIQRRLLADLAEPRTFAHLATHYRSEAPKLEYELLDLVQADLVTVDAPSADVPGGGAYDPGGVLAAGTAPSWKPGLGAYVIATSLGFGAAMLILLSRL
ncbi:MAG: hypothetical protein IT522_18085 [Burkholderiales bacterium]|nr:hypothetical protein [Burkholderiales bacterium]